MSIAAGPARATSRRTAKADPALLEAVELARDALVADVGAVQVGDHLGTQLEGERVLTHLFGCRLRGYRGWRWAVTLARASRAKVVTVDETALLPGPEAVVAPAWLPWSERVRIGDLGAGDLLPVAADDPRLVPGWTGADEDLARPGGDEDLRGVLDELGLRRSRVLSVTGRDAAAERWNEGPGGPRSAVAEQAPARCVTCGFAVAIRGALGAAFAVCANEHSPRDGAVVSLGYGCGAHSDVDVPSPSEAADPVLDTVAHDQLPDPIPDRVPDRMPDPWALALDTVAAVPLAEVGAPRARRSRSRAR